ncbi:MAG: hypothetical protein WC872_00695 [Candidatus Absconditabacterales bacterium]|jgi:polyferredoxin
MKKKHKIMYLIAIIGLLTFAILFAFSEKYWIMGCPLAIGASIISNIALLENKIAGVENNVKFYSE